MLNIRNEAMCVNIAVYWLKRLPIKGMKRLTWIMSQQTKVSLLWQLTRTLVEERGVDLVALNLVEYNESMNMSRPANISDWSGELVKQYPDWIS
jgi:hypothetical protein